MKDFIEINPKGKTDISEIKNHRVKITRLRLDGNGNIGSCKIRFGKKGESDDDFNDEINFFLDVNSKQNILSPRPLREIFYFDSCLVLMIVGNISSGDKLLLFFEPPI